MRTLKLLIVLLLSSLCFAQEAPSTKPSSLVAVTFYYQRSFHPGLGNIIGLKSGRNDYPLEIFTEAKSNKLISIKPDTFVTIQLTPGAHLFGAHHYGFHPTPSAITIPNGQSAFVRISVPQGWHAEADKEGAFQLTSCEQAKQEGGRMTPVKTKDIHVPMSKVVDTGAYFQPNCK